MRSGYRMMMHWKVLWEATYPSILGRRKVDVDSRAQRPKKMLYLCDNTSGQDKRAKRTNRRGHLALAGALGTRRSRQASALLICLSNSISEAIAGTFDLFFRRLICG